MMDNLGKQFVRKQSRKKHKLEPILENSRRDRSTSCSCVCAHLSKASK